jgi:hypothetical protein
MVSILSLKVDRKRARRLASPCEPFQVKKFLSRSGHAGVQLLDINDEAKQIVQDLGAAINAAVENSSQVAEAIERLRDAGYEMELTLRLEIGLRPHTSETADDEPFDWTDEDRRALRRMKIRIDEGE